MRLTKLIFLCFLGLGLSPVNAQAPKVTAMNPQGIPPPIRLVAMAPRLSTLDGKTIYFVDARYVGGDVFLKEMMSWFSAHMPKARLEFRQKAGAYAEADPQLWDEIRQKGDAVIMAIGH